jgi:formylglycine-generating enzyme required for sulfatase activity
MADSPSEPEGSPNPAAASTTVDVNVTAGSVQGGQVTGVQVGTIHGPVTIIAASGAVDQEAARRAAAEARRQPAIALRAFEPQTLFIPAGPFPMGTDDPAAPDWERPQHAVNLPDYRIGRYPVTVRQYAAFVRQRKEQPAPPGWFNREPPPALLDHPVVDVSWRDALAYCAWLSQQTGRRYTLPSEAEWEKAALARQGDKVTGWQGDGVKDNYPWGDQWVDGRCNVAGEGTTAVTAYPAGASAYGVEDLLGDVQEWTRSLWGSQPAQPDFGYPYDPDDGRELLEPSTLPAQARLVHRGGSFKSQPADLRCTARGNALPDSRIEWRGMRVVLALD